MKFLITALMLLCSTSFASEVRFNCTSDNGSIHLQGVFSTKTAKVKIYDQQNLLEVKELALGEVVRFDRSLRKNEDKYSFAKFYSDFNAWQGLELSFPKTVLTESEEAVFATFLTVYEDNGDIMVPGESTKFSCKTR